MGFINQLITERHHIAENLPPSNSTAAYSSATLGSNRPLLRLLLRLLLDRRTVWTTGGTAGAAPGQFGAHVEPENPEDLQENLQEIMVLHVFTNIYICVYMYMYMYMYIYIYMYVHTHIYICICTHIHIYTYTYIYMCICNMYVYIYTYYMSMSILGFSCRCSAISGTRK